MSTDLDTGDGLACSAEPSCITCGDVAVVLTVVSTDGPDAQCRDGQGRREVVATELVGDVQPGDRVLAHAGVAIQRVTATPSPAAADR